jgi:hypothetical protein
LKSALERLVRSACFGRATLRLQACAAPAQKAAALTDDIRGTPRILTSQLPVSRWHEQIGDPTLADGILDRLAHNAHRIEMRGDSMHKNRGKPSG